MNESYADIQRIRQTYPMYQRYWCCGLTIGCKHAPDCPSVPTPDGLESDEECVEET